ncbi:selenoprotein P-like [Amblyomma americanum]
MSDLQFLVVNDRQSAHLREHLEQRVSFAVHQESEQEPVWSIMGGSKDDVFIFDRCGRLSYYVPFPISLVLPGYLPVVEDALRRTYDGTPCGLMCQDNTDRATRAAHRHSLGWRILHMFSSDGEEGESTCDARKALELRTCCHPNSRTESPFCQQAPSCSELAAACGS